MKYEKIFEYGGEGGSICITRRKSDSGEKFIFHKSEINFTDEEFDDSVLNKTVQCNSFDEAFELNNEYPWHSLYWIFVHVDYRNIIIQKLVAKLNEESFPPVHISHTSETCLRILLKHKIINGKNIWSYNDISKNDQILSEALEYSISGEESNIEYERLKMKVGPYSEDLGAITNFFGYSELFKIVKYCELNGFRVTVPGINEMMKGVGQITFEKI